MDYKVKKIHKGKAEYITGAIGNFQWRDTVDSLGLEVSFSFPHSYFDKQFKSTLDCGDIIVLYKKGKELFRAVVFDKPINGDDYIAYDYAYYLNKSETIVQFKKISATKAIEQLCTKFGVPIGEMPNMATSITKVYKDWVVSDIIKDILKKVKKETGQGYRLEMQKGKLCIIKSGYIKVKPTYTDRTGKVISCTKASSISGNKSIQELRNEVVVAGTDEKKTQIMATAKSSSSIKKYGLLSVVETKEKTTSAKARNIAKNTLKELNKVHIAFTAEMPGNNLVRSARLIYFDRPEVGIEGWFKVKSCTHTLNNGLHWMSCELEG